MIQEFQELWPKLLSGELPAYAGLAMLIIRVLRSVEIQSRLPSWLKWPSNHLIGLAIVFWVALAVTFGGAMIVGGMSPVAALMASFPVTAAAVLAHKTTQAVGAAVFTAGEVSVSRPYSIVLPPPKIEDKLGNDRRA